MTNPLEYFSATQLQLADDTRSREPSCLARWAFKYVEKLPDHPAGKGAQRGTEGHERIEMYLTTGHNNLDALEMLGLQEGFVPRFGSGTYYVEQPIGVDYAVLNQFQLWGYEPIKAMDVPMVGYIDLVQYDAATGTLVLTDWKFKKDVKKYGCRDADLLDPNHEAGIQMLSYAAWGAANASMFPGLARIRVRHVTFQTQGAKSVTMTQAEAELTKICQLWDTVSRRIVPRMKEAATKPASQAAKNDSLCHKYPPLGCAYKNVCLNTMGRFAASFNQGKKPMGMLGNIMNGTGNGNASAGQIQTSSAPPPPAPTHKIVIQDESVTMEIAAKDAKPQGLYRVGAFIATFLATANEQAVFLPQNGGVPFGVGFETKILPLVAAPAPIQAPVPPIMATTGGTVTPAPSAPVAQAPTTPVVATPPTTEATPAPKAKRMKKTWTKHETQDGGVVRVSRLEEDEEAPTATGYEGVRLYIGCSPLGVATKTLDAFVAAVEAATLEGAVKAGFKDVPVGMDIRISAGQDLGFGKWKPYFASQAKETPIEPGHYVVIHGDERVDCATQALMSILVPFGQVTIGGR